MLELFFYFWAIFRESKGNLELRMMRQDAELLSQEVRLLLKKERPRPIRFLAHVGKSGACEFIK